MLWTASTTGIAMCQYTVDVAERLESAYGYERTPRPRRRYVRFAPNSGRNWVREFESGFDAVDGSHQAESTSPNASGKE